MNRFTEFTTEEKRKMSEAIWRRQRSFIAGDRQFREYGALLDEILDSLGEDYVPGRVI